MSIVRRVLLAASLGAMLVQPALSQSGNRPTEEALAVARTFVEASGATAQFDQIMPLLGDQMTKAFIGLAPTRSNEIRDVMAEVVKRFTARKSELLDEVAGIYADKLSIGDMREITKFYQSGAGRRLVLANPEVTRRAAAVGQAWGQRIGAEIATEMRRELKKRGIEL